MALPKSDSVNLVLVYLEAASSAGASGDEDPGHACDP